MSPGRANGGGDGDILVRRKGAVLIPTLNRPRKMNALLTGTVDRFRGR